MISKRTGIRSPSSVLYGLSRDNFSFFEGGSILNEEDGQRALSRLSRSADAGRCSDHQISIVAVLHCHNSEIHRNFDQKFLGGQGSGQGKNSSSQIVRTYY